MMLTKDDLLKSNQFYQKAENCVEAKQAEVEINKVRATAKIDNKPLPKC